jgi:hypothetical protein
MAESRVGQWADFGHDESFRLTARVAPPQTIETKLATDRKLTYLPVVAGATTVKFSILRRKNRKKGRMRASTGKWASLMIAS